MSMIRRILPILLAACLVMTSCRSRKEGSRTQSPDTTANTTVVTPSTPSTTPSTPATPRKPVYQPHYYTCTFTCSAQGVTANGQMRLQSDSVIWICATKIVELGRARFTPDSVIAYAKVMNRCFQGTYDDLYQRFRYRTTFKQLYRHVTSDNAEQELTDLFRRFGIESTIKLDPVKEVDKLNFPISIPKNAKPL